MSEQATYKEAYEQAQATLKRVESELATERERDGKATECHDCAELRQQLAAARQQITSLKRVDDASARQEG